MFALEDPEVFWLNVTNYGLGVLCAICIVVVLVGVTRDLVDRRRRALAQVLRFDDHAFRVPRLGMTMADGGRRVDEAGDEPPASG
jgi:hypothetical protein